MNRWQQVAQLGDEARQRGLNTGDSTEWLPFIEGYTQVGRYDDATEVTRIALQAMPTVQPALCNMWKRLEDINATDANRQTFVANIKAQLSCSATVKHVKTSVRLDLGATLPNPA
jgi:hypothetical protein